MLLFVCSLLAQIKALLDVAVCFSNICIFVLKVACVDIINKTKNTKFANFGLHF